MNDMTSMADPPTSEAASSRARPAKPALHFQEGTAGNVHRLVWQHEGALKEVFGTEDDVPAQALLRHCVRSLPLPKSA